MKILYFDCFAGISGDMALGAFLDMGIDRNSLAAELKKLGVGGWELSAAKDSRGGVFGTKAEVEICEHHCAEDAHSEHGEHHHHHHAHSAWRDIKALIEKSSISDGAKNIAIKIFSKLAEAEAEVHGKPVDEVMFHEVGAIDSIIDIVGCAVCVDMLKPDAIKASAVELGSGTVKCAHGVMPVPAPATAKLAKNFAAKIGGAPHECTTPTGAAIIAALADEDSKTPSGKISKSGIGIGHRDVPELPNFLRISMIDTSEDSLSQDMSEFAANIDDMTPEVLAFAKQKIAEAGALDVWIENILMKKNRAAVKLCALAKEADADKVRRAFFTHTTTIGIRETRVQRTSLPRTESSVKTSLGNVRVKFSGFEGNKKFKVEFDDLQKIAAAKGISILRATEIVNGQIPQA